MNTPDQMTAANQAMVKPVTMEMTEEDEKAIEKLNQDFARMKAAFLKDQYPDAKTRIERVLKIRDMFAKYRHEIRAAMDADYGNHPAEAVDLFEVATILGRTEFVAANLETWMTPTVRKDLTPLTGDSIGYMRLEPKGVVGNMSPWNFPFEIACGPLIEILAAGNRAILKPSEVTPRCSELLQQMIAETFDDDLVTTAIGGVPLAEHFSTLRWDHLIYTGNSTIARKVMSNCAQNLVPVTLELGGKAPAIVDSNRVDAETVRLIVGMKATKRGQVCINVDYCMVPEQDVDKFVELLKADISNGLMENNFETHACSIVSDRHLARAQKMLDEAEAKGATIITLGEDNYREDRNMPFKLVLNAPKDCALMNQEIFAPIIPIVPYKTVDDVLNYVNAGECPLALYVFSQDREFLDKVLDNTRSGGISINTCGGHVQGELGFGGVGESGMGLHHGLEGFREFSNERAVMEFKNAPAFVALVPPYGEPTKQVLGMIFGESGE